MVVSSPELPPPEHAVILAAGRGSRLEPEEGYKLLVEIGEESLFDRHLRNFRRLGVSEVTVVTGYRHADLDRAVRDWNAPADLDLHVAVNPAFDAGNGLSVLAGVDQARRNDSIDSAVPFWLTMSDHVFDPSIFERLAERVSEGGSTAEVDGMLAVDEKLETIYDLEDANTIRTNCDGRLEAIGKQLESFDRVDCGLFWCGDGFVEALDEVRRERGDCSTSDAVRALADSERFGWFDIGDGRWQDVDTPGAREHAERLFGQPP